MKIFLILTSLFGFFAPTTAPTNTATYNDITAHCNAELDYCLSYPKDVFVKKGKLYTDSFLVLTSSNEDAHLLLSHHENELEMKLMGVAQKVFSAYEQNQRNCKQLSLQRKSANNIAAEYQLEYEWHYIEILLTEKGYLTLQLTMPTQATDCDFKEVIEKTELQPFRV